MLYQPGDQVCRVRLAASVSLSRRAGRIFKLRDGLTQILSWSRSRDHGPAGTRLIRLDGGVIPAPPASCGRRAGAAASCRRAAESAGTRVVGGRGVAERKIRRRRGGPAGRPVPLMQSMTR